MKKNLAVRIIAILLVIALTGGLLAGCGKTDTPGNKSETNNETVDPSQQSGTPTPTAIPEGYLQVTFALPKDATESEKTYTTLPETAYVAAGTQLGQLLPATRVSSLFLGWSYDEEGKQPAQDTDQVKSNLTLYPRFAKKDGMSDGGALTYVARNEVSKDFPFELISYGLTEAEVRALLSLENASLATDEVAFELVSVTKAEAIEWMMNDLGIDADNAEKIWEFAQKKAADKTMSFTTAVSGLSKDGKKAVDANTMIKLAERFAPLETEVSSKSELKGVDGESLDKGDDIPGIDVSKLDDVVKAVLSSMDIDLATATEEEIKAYYGIKEGDSLQRFWREDLGLSVEQVRALEDALLNREIAGDRWLVRPADGAWEGGYLYSLTIKDTSKLRFWFDDAATDDVVTEYNITVHQEEVQNISVDTRVKYIDASKVQGVEFVSILDLETDDEGNIIPKENAGSGVMTYSGEEKLAKGTVIAINKGEVRDNGFTDGDVTYIKVKSDLGGGKYEYENAELGDVIFLPDVIPVADDGSLSDGVITIAAKVLDFGKQAYKDRGLTADTKMEVGDYIAFFAGVLGGKDYAETGYGVITEIKEANGEYTVKYDIVTKERVYEDEDLLYQKLPEVEFTLSEVEEEELEESMRQEILNSGLVDETSSFLTALVLGADADIDSLEHADEIRNMKVKTGDGSEITLSDLRLLADGAERVEVSDVKVTFLLDYKLQHYAGKKGIRAEAAVSFTISIKIMEAGTLEIQPMIVFEQEFLMTPEIKVKRNKNKLGLTSSLDITASLEAGTYSGFGVVVTAMTKNNPNPNKDKDWEEMVGNFAADNGGAETDQKTREAKQKAAKLLIKAGNKLIDKAKKEEDKSNAPGGIDYNTGTGEKKEGEEAKQGMVSPGLGGDLPTKYSGMLSNEAKYINLVNKELAKADFPVDPMNIVHCGIKVNFVVALKINAMIGAGVTYANAKKYSYSFRAKIWGGGDEYNQSSVSKQSSVKDVETPNFRADFYAFGMVGLRVGVSIEVCVGLFSTDLDSVGVVASAGVYAELYGFLYCWYEWTSGKGSTSGAMGSLLFEIGIYANIDVKVQVGMGKAAKSWSLYSKKTPLLQLGCTEYPLDFAISPKDPKLSVNIKDGDNTVKVPDELFKIKLMALNSGKVAEKSMDSNNVCTDDAKTFTVTQTDTGEGNGLVLSSKRSWKQNHEDHFYVECYDLTGDKGTVIEGPSSFQYFPATNEIYICPVDNSKSEIWGKVVFSYKNNAFGFSTQKLQRTVYVHWKGTRQTAKVEYYVQDNTRYDEGISWRMEGTGSVSGYDGLRCHVDVTKALTEKFPGYILYHLGYPDETELKEKREKLGEELGAAEKKMSRLGKEWREASNGAPPSEDDELYKAANTAANEFKALDAMYRTICSLLDDYAENNQKAVDNGSGTTWFTLRGKNTIVRVYYINTARLTRWEIVGEDLALDEHNASLCSSEWSPDPNALPWYYGRSWHEGNATLVSGSKVMSFIPDEVRDFRKDTFTTEWYMYDYEAGQLPKNYYTGLYMRQAIESGLEALRNQDFSHLTKVDADTVVPDKHVVMIGVQTPKEYKVTWKDGDTVITTSAARFGDAITVPADLKVNAKTGMHLIGWKTGDGEELDADSTMPGHDIELYAVFEGEERVITWIADDGTTEVSIGHYGDRIYDSIPAAIGKKNYDVILRYGKDANSETVPYEALFENEDTTIYLRYVFATSRVTWEEDGKTIRTDIFEAGTTPTAPTLKARDGLDLAWMIDGKPLDEYYTLPKGDVTAKAYWHVHDWTGGQKTIPGTCSRHGATGDSCALCGMLTNITELPMDPDNHNYDDILLTEAMCNKEGSMLHRCLWCHTEETVATPVDPDNHAGTRVLGNEKEPTCVEPGYTGDYVCSECGAIFEEGKEIPATNVHVNDGLYVHEKEPNCTEAGYKASHCKYCGIEMERISIPVKEEEHVWGPEEVVTEPTCKNGKARKTCTLCGAVEEYEIDSVSLHDFVYDSFYGGSCVTKCTMHYTCSVCGATKEEEGNFLNIHNFGDPEILTAPTCFGEGEQKRICADCGAEVFETLPALGCDYGEVEYSWSAGYRKVTATKPCRRDHAHDIIESVETTMTVVKAPTCTESGETAYTTKEFTNSADFTAQTKTVTTDPIGHSWGDVTLTVDTAAGTMTAKHVCKNNAEHVETETAAYTSKVTKEAGLYTKGETTYTATFTNGAFGTKSLTLEDIPAGNLDGYELTITLSEDGKSATAKLTKTGDDTFTPIEETTENVTLLSNTVTCEADGRATYRAVFADEPFGVQEFSVDVKKLGHHMVDDADGTVTQPEQVFDENGYCLGWKPGSVPQKCDRDGCTKTGSRKILVSIAVNSEFDGFDTEDGLNLVLDLKQVCLDESDEDYTCTLVDLFGEEDGHLAVTLNELVNGYFAVTGHSEAFDAEHPGWYLPKNHAEIEDDDTEEEAALKDANSEFFYHNACEVCGTFTLSSKENAITDMEKYLDEYIPEKNADNTVDNTVIKLKYTPSSTEYEPLESGEELRYADVFESAEITLTIIWPEE